MLHFNRKEPWELAFNTFLSPNERVECNVTTATQNKTTWFDQQRGNTLRHELNVLHRPKVGIYTEFRRFLLLCWSVDTDLATFVFSYISFPFRSSYSRNYFSDKGFHFSDRGHLVRRMRSTQQFRDHRGSDRNWSFSPEAATTRCLPASLMVGIELLRANTTADETRYISNICEGKILAYSWLLLLYFFGETKVWYSLFPRDSGLV